MKHSAIGHGSFLLAFLMLFSVFLISLPSQAYADSATEINIGVTETLKRFRKEVPGGNEFLQKAQGVLVFPSVIKAGFVVGGEYGEGALLIDGKTVQYYSTASASIGFQLGAQSKSIVVVFLTKQALEKFRTSKGWEAGVDGSVALIKWGMGKDINTVDITDPIVGFVFSNEGLMYNLTLEGSKYTKIDRK